MRHFRFLAVPAIVSLSLAGPAMARQAPDCLPADNQRLCEIYEADQADRTGGDIDWSQVGPRDQARRAEVADMLQAGDLDTAHDFFRAAMVYQHGKEWPDYAKSHLLATQAAILDPAFEQAKWLSAAAWDRMMLHLDQAQWFGTQFTRAEDASRFTLRQPAELGQITQSQRDFFAVPDWEENLEAINARYSGG